MTRRLLPRILTTVLVGLVCFLPVTAMQPPECQPTAMRTQAAPKDQKLRPVPAPPGATTTPVPVAPFPPAGTGTTARAAPATLPVPTVAIRMRAPAEVAPGQKLTYQLVAENISRADAHHVTVRVPIPTNARYASAKPEPAEKEPILVWKLGTLRGGEKKEIELVFEPTGGEVSCCARVQFEHGQCVKTKMSQPGVQIRKIGPSEAAKYDPLKFKIEVINSGKIAAKNLVIEETLPAGLDYSNSKPSTTGENPLVWEIPELLPGQTRIVEYDAIPSVVGSLTTKAVVKASGGIRRESAHTLKIGEPNLSVLMLGPKGRLVGRSATYQLTVRNTGSLPATHVELSDELPGEIEYLSSTASGKLEREHVRWNLGTIQPGASRSVQVTVRARMAGSFKNVCTVSADRGLTEQAKTRTEFAAPTGLALELIESEERVAANRSTSWTLRVLNRGQSNEKNLSVVVRLPEGVTADVRNIPKAQLKDGKILLPVLELLSPGRDAPVVFRLRADKAGHYPIVAEATSDAHGPDNAIRIEETFTVGDSISRTSFRSGSRVLEKAAFLR